MGMTWKERWCLYWHRDLMVLRHYPGSKHVCCARCGCEFGINDSVRVVLPWRDVADEMRHIS